jgi:AcrR family transcriptional regulator
MTDVGLRARKKEKTRTLIAETAARLFAAHGYHAVTVVDVARAADVAEKTVYNYFPTKESLAFDRDEDELARLTAILRERPPNSSPAAAIREDALALLASIADIPDDQLRGTVGVLATLNPAVRRGCLEMFDRHADALAEVLLDELPGRTTDALRLRMRAYTGQMTWIYLTIVDQCGRRLARGASARNVVRQMRPILVALLDDFEAVNPPRP